MPTAAVQGEHDPVLCQCKLGTLSLVIVGQAALLRHSSELGSCVSLSQQLPCSRDTQVLACLPCRVNSPMERELEAPPRSHCSRLSLPYK